MNWVELNDMIYFVIFNFRFQIYKKFGRLGLESFWKIIL